MKKGNFPGTFWKAKMKKLIPIEIILFSMGLMLISCAGLSLRKSPDETKNPEIFVEGNYQESDDSSQTLIDLDRLDSSAILVLDSLSGSEDTTAAIDDYVWRELNQAQEYCAMGVMANRETAWEEAEYYFEKSLAILGELDIDTETDSLTEEAVQYDRLLAEIAANYRTTLVSLGRLSSDISPDVLISRFSEVNHIKIDSAQLVRLESYAQEKSSYNVPVILNERVKSCILYYQTVARDAFAKYLGRSTKYMPMAIKIFEEYGLPSDLVYLAIVESGFNPHAYSWARAMGMWQFIAETGRLYNMERTWWYDERKDPVKSSHAAARFLKDLYDEFGSWELALAAYNGGPQRIRNTTKKQDTHDFWKLKLKKQTMDYVPFFMAAVMICKDPERFGFTDINYQPEWVYDEVQISKSLELKTVASALGCTLEELRELNPELLRQYTPPNAKRYNLRVPSGMKERFLAVYDELPSSKETNWVQHKVRKGESVGSIARKYGVSEYAIREANNLSSRSKIYAGKVIIVPAADDRAYSSSKSEKNKNYESEDDVYIVRSGDTVSDIARAFGTTAAEIRRLNNLGKKSQIFVGQEIRVRASGKSGKSDKRLDGSGAYTVRSGDTIWDIARHLGISPDALRSANDLDKNAQIFPGQKLVISNKSNNDKSFKIYIVKPGDTIYAIAALFNTTVSRILSWNELADAHNIRAGLQLKIYSD